MDAFRNDMHGRLLRDEIPVYDYLIELAPFALVFMTTRELSYMGACEQIIIGTRCGICDLRIFRKGLGSEYLGNTSVLRGTSKVSPVMIFPYTCRISRVNLCLLPEKRIGMDSCRK